MLAMRKKKSFSLIEIRVVKILESAKISCNIHYLGESKMNAEDKHRMDAFSVVFTDSDNGKSEIYKFHTGLGHRTKGSFGSQVVTKPSEADILYCLLNDMQFGKMSFQDFCDDLGYNYDSIKDLNMHRSLEQDAKRTEKFFKFAIPALEVALQDY